MQFLSALMEPELFHSKENQRPSAWWPFLLMLGLSLLATWLYYNWVDTDWLTQLGTGNKGAGFKIVIEKVDEDPSGGSNAEMVYWPKLIALAIGMPLSYAIFALYYLVVGNFYDIKRRFGEWYGFVVWTSLPQALSCLLVLFGTLSMAPQTTFESLQLSHLAPLLVQPDSNSVWKSLLGHIDLLSLWTMILVALGWKKLGQSSLFSAIGVAVLPSLLIYGGWAVLILIRT